MDTSLSLSFFFFLNTAMEKLKQENINALVTRTEDIITKERDGWKSLSESTKDLKEITNVTKNIKSNVNGTSDSSTKSTFESAQKEAKLFK